ASSTTTGEPDEDAHGHRPHGRGPRPPLDALRPPIRDATYSRRGRALPDRRRRRTVLPGRPRGPVHRAGRPRPPGAGAGGGPAGRGAGVLPAVVLRAPGGDRPRRAAPPTT